MLALLLTAAALGAQTPEPPAPAEIDPAVVDPATDPGVGASLVGASLVLGADIVGRVTLRTAANELVVDVAKKQAAPLLLGLSAGEYLVRVDDGRTVAQAHVQLVDGVRTPLTVAMLHTVATTELPAKAPATAVSWGAAAATGAISAGVGYGLGVGGSILATNGSNPANAAFQHAGDSLVQGLSLGIPVATTGIIAALTTLFVVDWHAAVVSGLVASATVALAHASLLGLSAAGVTPDPAYVEGLVITVVGVTTAVTTGAAAAVTTAVE